MKQVRAIAFMVLVAMPTSMVTASCGTATFILQQYPGPERPPETIALIRINGEDPIIWDSLDGESAGGTRVAENTRFHVEILPGPHRIGFRNANDPELGSEVISFQADAGRVYRPVFVRVVARGGASFEARVYEVNDDTDVVVRDVTAVDRPKAGAAR